MASDLPSILTVSNLRETASWIRDELDPIVAREGPNELNPDDVLTIHTILLALQQYPISLWTLRFSRIHLAVGDICGKATRWPTKLADEADNVVEHLQRYYGRLRDIQCPIFERGSRLWGICEQRDLTRDDLMKRFASYSPKFVDNARAYCHGSLGFKPGQWWINGMFAFRDGIIDDKCTDGGICYNENGAYAIVMRKSDEESANASWSFTYKCSPNDRGKYRLTAADFKSRYPVRVLRSHTLCSLWAPRVGIRYDGLYKITGWVCKPVHSRTSKHLHLQYLVRLERDEPSSLMADVLRHPCAEEIDDYKAYRQSCKDQRDAEKRGAEMLDARNKSRTVVENLAQGQGLGLAHAQEERMNIMNIKAQVDVANLGAGVRLPSQDVVSPRSGVYRNRMVSLEANDANVGAGIVSASQTTTTAMVPSRNASYRSTATRRNLDGSSDEPHSTRVRKPHPQTQDEDDDVTSPPSISNHTPILPFHPQTANSVQLQIWASLFSPIEWSSNQHYRRRSGIARISVIEPTSSPLREPFGARARGDFEIARARTPRPENARQFLEAQSKVWRELAEAEYVDREVDRKE